MRILVNGEPREVKENISLPELIAGLSLKAEQVAIELNQNVVRRAEWETTMLQANDRVEIVHFVGGGCKSVGNKQWAEYNSKHVNTCDSSNGQV